MLQLHSEYGIIVLGMVEGCEVELQSRLCSGEAEKNPSRISGQTKKSRSPDGSMVDNVRWNVSGSERICILGVDLSMQSSCCIEGFSCELCLVNNGHGSHTRAWPRP